MMPIRRQRMLTFCAIIIVFMLYRVVQNSWDDSSIYAGLRAGYEKPLTAVQPPPGEEVEDDSRLVERPFPAPGLEEEVTNDKVEEKEAVVNNEPKEQDETSQAGYEDEIEIPDRESETVDLPSHDVEDLDEEPVQDSVQTKGKQKGNMQFNQEVHRVGTPTTGGQSDELNIEWKNLPNDAPDDDEDEEEEEPVHWQPFPEHFPVPEESIIPLPRGKSKPIPRVQAAFEKEPEDQRATRMERQERVKTEIARAWSAYREHAWMHDELMPVSGDTKDPFCGWAATLVDSLDTLWIAGLEEEFDEAAKAVGNIDFTTTDRSNIPVFETVIRYLGGMLAAYDVSGGHQGKYQVLLDKAVELGDILMSIFDTPNRMPVLYYEWQPEHASQPRRASRAGIAELATLSMEFTRLAQLTDKDKYYDAIARITDNLVEMQEIGTQIPGLFPENLDIGGCKKAETTVTSSISKTAQKQIEDEKDTSEPVGYVPVHNIERTEPEDDESTERRDSELTKRDYAEDDITDFDHTVPDIPGSFGGKERQPPLSADGSTSEWDCEHKPFEPAGRGRQSYHMGGAQDSAYEYFPKEYLLLGGQESKYRKLYEDAVTAVNEWLLFRPMANDDDEWDVLFPARLATYGNFPDDAVAEFEVTHLTCFIGGMYGLGGKIFERQEDIEVAKKLTDGCVWAYQMFPSGLMPETSKVMQCPTLDKCEFNETMYWDHLDSSGDFRDEEVLKWEQQEQLRLDAERLEGASLDDATESEAETYSSKKKEQAEQLENSALEHGADELVSADDRTVRKRAAVPAVSKEYQDDADSELPDSLKEKLGLEKGAERDAEATKTVDEDEAAEEVESTEDDDDDEADTSKSVPKYAAPQRMTPAHKKQRPASHKEYVERRIKYEGLPRGFTEITARSYILRPEAIESVWYMYRITGDPAWMEKGWTMFKAVVAATRTSMANSAVLDVTEPIPDLVNAMESFWIAETLKYYYLLFSEPDVISLDEWVLNTEAHPFRRPT